MKKLFITSILLIQIILLNSTYSFAQNFAPLNLGNVWVWENIEWSTIEKSTIVDTNYLIAGNFYYKIRFYESSNLFRYLRFNHSDSLFYYYDSSRNLEIPYYKLNCVLGDTFSYPLNQFARFTKEVVDVYQTNVFDTIVTVKVIHYSAGGLVEGTELWTDEFGMLYQDQSEGWTLTFLLRGCIINGIAYGDTSFTVGIEDESIITHNFSLYQNYPNPFNPTTTIEYELKEYSFISLKVYDLLGNEISTLVNEEKYPGKYSINFNGSNLASGVYFYKLLIGGNSQIRKMILLR